MIRFIHCVKRRDDVPQETFRRYWTDEAFDRLIQRMAALHGASKVSRNLTLQVDANKRIMEERGSDEPYDGIIEYWWDSASQLMEIYNSEESRKLRAEMMNYQSRFVDFSASSAFFTEG